MSKCISLFLFILCASFASSQTTEKRTLTGFDKVFISGILNAVLENGPNESVSIESANIPTSKIITEMKGSALYVYIDNKNESYRNVRVKVLITCKNLVAIHRSGSGDLSGGASFTAPDFNLDASGSGNIHLDGSIKGKAVTVNKSGSGNIKVQSIEADKISIMVSGSGNTEISKGSTQQQNIRLSGSGNINMPEVRSETCTATISGSGDIDIHVSKSLDGKISGSGNITYHGEGQVINAATSGSGRIHKKS